MHAEITLQDQDFKLQDQVRDQVLRPRQSQDSEVQGQDRDQDFENVSKTFESQELQVCTTHNVNPVHCCLTDPDYQYTTAVYE